MSVHMQTGWGRSLFNQSAGSATPVDLNQFLNLQRGIFGAGQTFGSNDHYAGCNHGQQQQMDPMIMIQMMLMGVMQHFLQQLMQGNLQGVGQMLGQLGGGGNFANGNYRGRGWAPGAVSGTPGGHVQLSNDPNPPTNGRASVDRIRNAGARNQMISGRVTVNGNTYNYNSGGGGRGSLPSGEYTVTSHMNSRNDRTMQVGGVGYSFALSDKFDPRVGANRSLLRIHPDGGGAGTIGCLGIVGNAATQAQFRRDMNAELQRNGGRFTLRVG